MDFVANTVVRLRTCVVLLEMPQDSACMDSNKCRMKYQEVEMGLGTRHVKCNFYHNFLSTLVIYYGRNGAKVN